MAPTTTDHYRVLDLEEKKFGKPISASELKNAYRQALLRHHPDKVQDVSSSITSAATVDEITEAYKILADPSSREEHDRALKTYLETESDGTQPVHTRHTGMETVDLEDLELDEDKGVWSKACRCGSQPAFIVTEPELEKNAEFGELVTGCKGCSLWLKVLFSVEDG